MTAYDDYSVSLAPNEGWDERILVVRCGKLVNSFIAVTERYVILIDTLINAQTASELLHIAGEFLVDGRQLLVVNTHADYDHCWGNQVFAGPSAIYPAPIIGTRRCAERFFLPETEQLLQAMTEQEPDVYGDVPLAPPTVLFDDQLIIDGGDLTLRLFATPGHQPDHVAIMIPQLGLLLPGDAAESPFPFAESAEAMPQLRASLAHMAALNPAMALYCHAPVTIGPDLLRQNIVYFDTLEQRCRDAIVNFPLIDAVPPVDGEEYPEFYLDGHAAQVRLMLEYLGNRP